MIHQPLAGTEGTTDGNPDPREGVPPHEGDAERAPGQAHRARRSSRSRRTPTATTSCRRTRPWSTGWSTTCWSGCRPTSRPRTTDSGASRHRHPAQDEQDMRAGSTTAQPEPACPALPGSVVAVCSALSSSSGRLQTQQAVRPDRSRTPHPRARTRRHPRRNWNSPATSTAPTNPAAATAGRARSPRTARRRLHPREGDRARRGTGGVDEDGMPGRRGADGRHRRRRTRTARR